MYALIAHALLTVHPKQNTALNNFVTGASVFL